MFAAFRVPHFPFLWLGLVCSFTSLAMQNLARGYLAYEITGSAAAIGVVLLAWGFPMIGMAMFAGVVADRVPKRNILICTQTTLGLSAFATAILAHLGIIEIWHMIALGIIQGVAFGFNVPTRQAILPEVAKGEVLTNGVALVNAGQSVAQIAAPSVAGVLLSLPFVGITGTLYLSAFLYTIVVFMIVQLPATPPTVKQRAPFLTEMRAGLSYVGNHRLLPILLMMQYVPWIIGMPYQQQMPYITSVALNIGPDGLGFLMASSGVGALVGALLVAATSATRYKGPIQLVSGLGFAATLFGFGISPNFWAALVCLFLVGVTSDIYVSLNAAKVMEETDPAYYGRVMSVSSLAGSIGPIAVFPYGLVMDAVGPRATVAGSALIIFAFLLIVGMLRPSLRQAERAPARDVVAAVR